MTLGWRFTRAKNDRHEKSESQDHVEFRARTIVNPLVPNVHFLDIVAFFSKKEGVRHVPLNQFS